ncbi:hypothetical protein EZV73_22160 [Acidaminobacter sp. JC074]|uniref:hypothetical protein n=1 Tax=Acidaminobacter sp. JC074 TaxID=2530199 RepID=UPI001F10E7C1|nr:hypothetical protein [Acidaminobacter sp. JC074]MCH4890303.1 hypothetical protein [Acidaminobacter sp. JC074]
MKKSRFLIGILVLAVMLMGAGYAAWSQSFTVQATVDSGQMSFDLTAIQAESPEDTGNYIEESCGIETIGNVETVVASIENLYPLQYTTFGWTVTNTGSMGIMVDPDMFLPSNVTPHLIIANPNGQDLDDALTVMYSLDNSDWKTEGEFVTLLTGQVIAPTESQSFYVKLTMKDQDNDDFENCKVKYTTPFIYKQTEKASTLN